MRLTTARYYTPSGRSIQAKGIEPDIIVEQAKIEPIKQNDKMRMEADLRRRLENLEDQKAKEKLKKPQSGDESDVKKDAPDAEKDSKNEEKDEKDDKKATGRDDDASQDFQLQRAIDLLRAAHVFNLSTTDK